MRMCVVCFLDNCFGLLRGVGAYYIAYDCSAERTLTAANAAPLLDGAIVAHAHMPAHVEHRINGILIADGALGAGIGALLVAETVLPFGAVQCAGALGNRLHGYQRKGNRLILYLDTSI